MPESPFSKPPAKSEIDSLPEVQKVETQEDMDAMMAKAQEALGGVSQAAEEEPKKEVDPVVEEIVADVTTDQRRAFIRSLLAGERFQHTVDLFGGDVRVTFCSRRVSENKIARKLAKQQYEEPQAAYRELVQLAFSLEELTCGELSLTRTDIVSDTTLNLDTLGKLNDILYYAVLNEFRAFEDICDALFKKANDPDFWSRTGGAI